VDGLKKNMSQLGTELQFVGCLPHNVATYCTGCSHRINRY